MVRIRPADRGEGGRLRELAIASKLHWGYDVQDVLRWVEQGDFSPEGLAAKEFYVADADGRVVGFASLEPGEVARLEDLWVEPDWIGKGVGSLLFRFVAERAAALGSRTLEWEAEPHAVGFYERMGGRHLRTGGPSAFGRQVPVMGMDL